MNRPCKPVFFNLFEVAEPEMSSESFAEPKINLKKLRGTQMALKKFAEPKLPSKNFAETPNVNTGKNRNAILTKKHSQPTNNVIYVKIRE